MEKLDAAGVTPSAFREPDPAPAWLIDPLIAVSVDAAETEHVARATITLIQPLCRAMDVPVDLTAFVPDLAPGWIQHMRLTPFYLRSGRSLLFRGPDTLQ